MEAARSYETSVTIYQLLLDNSTVEEKNTTAFSINRHHINHGRNLTCQKNVVCTLRLRHLQNSRYLYKVSENSVFIVGDESYQAGSDVQLLLPGSLEQTASTQSAFIVCAPKYSDTLANEDSSFRNHIR